MEIQNAGTKKMTRPDDAILDHIWRSLWLEHTIQAIDIHDISVAVDNGQVCISGHVSKEYNNQRIEEIIWAVPGVVAVHNHVVIDHDLSNHVALALGYDERTRPFVLSVSCYHGWVEVGGTVPTRELQHTAEATAASVTDVRGVILLPNIKGENTFQVRDPVQPGIGAQVFGEDGTEGTVYQVVINPQNRLVTHAIVRVNRTTDGYQESYDYLLPVEAMRVVNPNSINLIHRAPESVSYPIFTPAYYPFPPLIWQPPYPYKVGSVRWLRNQKLNTERCNSADTEKAAML
jgi:osmotically-inducible protein OsmY/sporulation protein YlmC with PRC-barrel domain